MKQQSAGVCPLHPPVRPDISQSWGAWAQYQEVSLSKTAQALPQILTEGDSLHFKLLASVQTREPGCRAFQHRPRKTRLPYSLLAASIPQGLPSGQGPQNMMKTVVACSWCRAGSPYPTWSLKLTGGREKSRVPALFPSSISGQVISLSTCIRESISQSISEASGQARLPLLLSGWAAQGTLQARWCQNLWSHLHRP